MAHEDTSVARWRKYGKDRLYVTTADGTKLGWWDLATGECHPEFSEYLDTVADASADWCAANNVPLAASATAGEPPVEAPTPVNAPSPAYPFTQRDLPAPATDPDNPPIAFCDDRCAHDQHNHTDARPVSTETEPTAPVQAFLATEEALSATDEPGEPEWADLATVRAGAAAREQALALKQTAPVRTFIARVFDVKNDERAWRIGADGEEMVAAQLNKLLKTDPRWRFLHAVPVGNKGSDIDHVVIGPAGVYTLNAKHHPNANIWVGGGTFLVNGQKQPYIRNSRYEATRAAKLLTHATGIPVHVTGIIVPVNARDITIKKEPDEGVAIVNRMALSKWLNKQPIMLTTDQIDTIYDAARRSTTWQSERPTKAED